MMVINGRIQISVFIFDQEAFGRRQAFRSGRWPTQVYSDGTLTAWSSRRVHAICDTHIPRIDVAI